MQVKPVRPSRRHRSEDADKVNRENRFSVKPNIGKPVKGLVDGFHLVAQLHSMRCVLIVNPPQIIRLLFYRGGFLFWAIRLSITWWTLHPEDNCFAAAVPPHALKPNIRTV